MSGAIELALPDGATLALDTQALLPHDAFALLVLAHGAGAGLLHPQMRGIAESLARVGVATLRFNFPFMQRGAAPRVDTQVEAVRAIVAAVVHARALAPALPVFAGGHSYGGRMCTHAAAEGVTEGLAADAVHGIVSYAFPLHGAGKVPGADALDARGLPPRAVHLPALRPPWLCVSGSRDALAEPALLDAVVARVPRARLHRLADADHGYAVRRKARQGMPAVLDELAAATVLWMQDVLAGRV